MSESELRLSLDVVVYGSENGKPRAIRIPDVDFIAGITKDRAPVWVDSERSVALEIQAVEIGPLPGMEPEYFAVERSGTLVGSGPLRTVDGVVIAGPAVVCIGRAAFQAAQKRRSA